MLPYWLWSQCVYASFICIWGFEKWPCSICTTKCLSSNTDAHLLWIICLLFQNLSLLCASVRFDVVFLILSLQLFQTTCQYCCQSKLANWPFVPQFPDSGKSAGCLHQSQKSSANKSIHTHLHIIPSTMLTDLCTPQTETQTSGAALELRHSFLRTKWLKMMEL